MTSGNELEPADYEQSGPGLFDDPDKTPCDAAAENGIILDDAPDPQIVDLPADPLPVDDAPLALYRRYRPDTFAEVIGQDHVTVPLMRAIDNNKVNHAYLFSGPRGCGKTTSARILARCLNCEQGPTSTPCGHCDSCRALATGGAGSIDVIEIDAASHGRVDDARDLREGVYFAPVHSRYKVYIIDEAHMVTKEGFNALLKVVEEPPPHVKFIFATTEPEKVIGTIRSRTHHYPFRLVPQRILTDYLASICEQEGVGVARGVLPLVVRAGAGSVRDSLSVLDQLLGGAGPEGVTYDHATALLGYTPEALLDEIVDAFAAGDGKGVYATIDKVMEVGQDPRRFAEDLLRRVRDLVIISQVPDAIEAGLIDVPDDQAERLTHQAASLGPGELTRAAEVIADGLVAMRGTTAPRLHLELICSRILLPVADLDGRGLHARVERLERRLDMTPGSEPAVSSQHEPAQRPPAQRVPAPRPAAQRPATQQPAQHHGDPPRQRPAMRPVSDTQERPVQDARERSVQGASSASQASPGTADVRRLWPQILDEVKRRKRFTYALLNQEAHVVEARDGKLLLGFSTPGIMENFRRGESLEILQASIVEVRGTRFSVDCAVDGGPITQGPATGPAPRVESSSGQPSSPSEDPAGASDDDDVLDDSEASIEELLARELDAQVIDSEEPDVS